MPEPALRTVIVPIFPLPDVVFFPHTYLPLHIFEPRYRQMTQEAIDGDKRIAMVLLKEGWEADYHGRPPIHEVAAVGELVNHERLDDGRFNIVLKALFRIAIEEELPPTRLYRQVRGRVLADRYPPGGEGELCQGAESLKVLCLRLLAEVRKSEPKLLRALAACREPGQVVDWIASVAVVGAELRQQILETLDVRARMGLVRDDLVDTLMRVSDRSDALPKGQAN